MAGSDAQLTLYDLEAQTQAALPRIGQTILQALAVAQGSGVEGSVRPCRCGQEQRYQDRAQAVGRDECRGHPVARASLLSLSDLWRAQLPTRRAARTGASRTHDRTYKSNVAGYWRCCPTGRPADADALWLAPCGCQSDPRDGEAREQNSSSSQRLARPARKAGEGPARQAAGRQVPTEERLMQPLMG